jgi:hypothetical protein
MEEALAQEHEASWLNKTTALRLAAAAASSGVSLACN